MKFICKCECGCPGYVLTVMRRKKAQVGQLQDSRMERPDKLGESESNQMKPPYTFRADNQEGFLSHGKFGRRKGKQSKKVED